ncbi:MAG: FtsX-like permease family protein [Candidatus Limnocylindrales bacterium]
MSRIGDDRILVAAAWLTIVIATTAMVASAMRSDAVARSAIQQVLAAAPAADADLELTASIHADEAEQVDGIVHTELSRALGPALGTTWSSVISDGYRLAGRAPRDILVFGQSDGLADHARLVAGAWPPAEADADGTMVAAISSAAAGKLGLEVGQRITVQGRGVDGLSVPVRIGGIYEPLDRGDRYWFADALALDGSQSVANFTTLGPLMVDRALLLGRLTDIWAVMRWRVLPNRDALDPTTVAGVAGGVGGLAGRIDADVGRKGTAEVASDLPALLTRATSGTRSSSSGILLLDGQVIILGGYALIMVAAMVVERRRGTTAVLRVRGATTAQLLRLAAAEAILLVVPAVLLAPVLAAGLLVVLGALGPAGTVFVAPRLTSEAVTLAAIAAGVAVIGMAIPVMTTSGPIASMRRSVGRQLSRTAAHRTGLDLAFVAFAAVVLWELRANGAPISQSFRGSVGIDPLLVAAPAIGLAAGAVLTMRVVPALATLLERLAARRPGVVGPMAARSIARRSSRYSRSALLLVVAVAIAFLAASYERTWHQSQIDQVSTAVPVDIIARAADTTAGALPSMVLARGAYQGIDGIAEAAPIVVQPFDTRRPNGRGAFVALVPELAAGVVDLRSDLASAPFADQLRAMAAARPKLSVVSLPAGATRLRVSVDSSVRSEPARGPSSIVPVSGPLDLTVTAVVRDSAGLLHRASSSGRVGSGTETVEIPLDLRLPDGTTTPPDGTLELVAVELSGTIPPGTIADGSARLTGLDVAATPSGATTSESDWTPLDMTTIDSAWTWAKVVTPRMDPEGRVSTTGPGASVGLDAAGSPPAGLDDLTMTVGARELAEISGVALPSLADERLVGLTPPAADGSVSLTQGFADIRTIDVVGTVGLVPTLDPSRPAALVDLPTMQLAEWVRSGALMPADGWWLTLDAGADPDAASAALAASPFPIETKAVRSDAIEARTNDPFQAGVTAILGLVAGAALLFALVGLAISLWYTVSSRRGEFAVARALGLARRQLLGWLAIESAFLIVVGVVGGILVGLVLAWVVMPSITLTLEGRAPVPPPVAAIAWDLAVGLLGLGAVAFLLSVLAARRAIASVRVAATLRIVEADR